MMKVAGQNLNLNAKYLWEQCVLLCMIECRDDIEGQHWFLKANILDLLEDEQGLSMGELLAVKFGAPSHESTFNVGIDLMSNLMVLTPLI